MIDVLRHPDWIPKLMRLYRAHFNLNPIIFEMMLYRAIGSKNEIVLFDREDQEVTGYIYVSIVVWNTQPVVFVQSLVLSKTFKHRAGIKEGLKMIATWAESKKIFKIVALTSHNPKAFSRLFGFRIEGTVMSLNTNTL